MPLSMIELNDKHIREAFIQRLLRSARTPLAIKEELRVHNGNAVADIVTLHKEAHCYEIKGRNDKIERAIEQGRFYDKAFRKVSVIMTPNHTQKALELTPQHWGLIEARLKSDQISFSYIRAAKINPYFDKSTALLTLWKTELLDAAVDITSEKLEKSSRQQLTGLLSKHFSKEQTSNLISQQLIERES